MAAPSFDLPRLKGLISQDDLPPETLLTILADHEATVCLLFNAEGVDRAGAPLLQLYYSAHLFALLLVDDLNEARFLTQRFPAALAESNEILARSKELLRAVWSRKYPLVYRALQPSNWPEEMVPLVHRYENRFRTSTFNLLSRAYTAIRPSMAAMYLGLVPSSPAAAPRPTPNASSSDRHMQTVSQPDAPEPAVPDAGASQRHQGQPRPASSTAPDPSQDQEVELVIIREVTKRGWGYDASQNLLLPKVIVDSPRSGAAAFPSASHLGQHQPRQSMAGGSADSLGPAHDRMTRLAGLVSLLGD